ncbi:SPOSA6832_03322, partial [Sporobolomyces salmonicolor]
MVTSVVSCPGKVLLAGGYLVLDRQHQGFVVSTPSRFFTVVDDITQEGNAGDHQAADERIRLTVRSPQFDDGLWEYEAVQVEGEWTVKEHKKEGVPSETTADSRSLDLAAEGLRTDACSHCRGSSNSFVHLSLQATLQLASALSPSTPFRSLDITIDATPIPFAPLNCTIRNVHKTGLGSSAAMVTSLTSSLFLHWTSPSSPSSSSRLPNPDDGTVQLMHNLAQYVHSLAQGKVGSGFDVSAAVYGSQVYKRFDVRCLGDLLGADAARASKPSATDLFDVLSPRRNPSWTAPTTHGSVSTFSLPPGVLLLLADVDAGSNTPSMVGKVMAWKKAQPMEAERVWTELGESNERLREALGALGRRCDEDKAEYEREVDRLAALPAEERPQLTRLRTVQWLDSPLPFAVAAQHILTIRSLMRHMGESSLVPIEPPEQTRLLDACSALPGVVGAGVPGAGGYDAIWVLCLSPSSALAPAPVEAVDALLRSYTAMSVRPLSRSAWVPGGTEEGERGLLRERIEQVEGLSEAVARGRK